MSDQAGNPEDRFFHVGGSNLVVLTLVTGCFHHSNDDSSIFMMTGHVGDSYKHLYR